MRGGAETVKLPNGKRITVDGVTISDITGCIGCWADALGRGYKVVSNKVVKSSCDDCRMQLNAVVEVVLQ